MMSYLIRALFFALPLVGLTACGESGAADSGQLSGYGVAGPSALCSSGQLWTQGNQESPVMKPGGDCISCHRSYNEGPLYAVAGTVMGAFDDQDDCAGVQAVTVQITGADGVVTTLLTNAAGNFSSHAVIATPFTAKVIGSDGSERAMMTPQTQTNCMTCHTAQGANGAPGRIVAP